jgi:dimethylamine/trimethylamine dehydrogenase
MVTARLPRVSLYEAVKSRLEQMACDTVKSVTRIGDCIAPGTIAAAVFSGRRYAEALDTPVEGEGILTFRSEPGCARANVGQPFDLASQADLGGMSVA